MGGLLVEELAPVITLRPATWTDIDTGTGAQTTQVSSLPGSKVRRDASIPLCLLELPLDILHGIIKEITHTNDLTSLALTCSDLHSLVIPHIYTRFDIVWPDFGPSADNRVGVDALTYGLSTLVMSPDVFGEMQCNCTPCAHLDPRKIDNLHQSNAIPSSCIRRGNHFARYTRKFSLGNGPEEWVREYLITKESGKMLGTLAAIAIGRMQNLESFHWDMPTGIVRDIWLALSSLAKRNQNQLCRLQSVWVRWHDNRDKLSSTRSSPSEAIMRPSEIPFIRSSMGTPIIAVPPRLKVEYPTFSILSPVESLSVLDIDELSCIEEVSVLIERSSHRLQELRIGLAKHATEESWAKPWPHLPTRSAATKAIGNPAQREGVLAVLLPQSTQSSGIPNPQSCVSQSESPKIKSWQATKMVQACSGIPTISGHKACEIDESQELDQVTRLFAVHNIGQQPKVDSSKECRNILRLRTLELERVYLSKPILSDHIEWSTLRSLTILGCQNTETVWKCLRRKFSPPVPNRGSLSLTTDTPPVGSPLLVPGSAKRPRPISVHDYKLGITKIHTDVVSAGLLAFIKDSLAPNTLEVLLLQQCEDHISVITLEQIYKCAVRRHRASLNKLLIDGAIRGQDVARINNPQRWCFDRELLIPILSDRLHLRELSLALDYNNWHYFLQRLPESSTLRSLHITHIANDMHGRIEPREAAQQIVDVVALRPECQLCFVGVQDKCFEILEINPVQATPTSGRRRAPNTDLQSSVQEQDETLEEYSNNSEIEHALNVVHPIHDTTEEEVSSDANSLADEHDLNSSSDETDEEATGTAQKRPVFKLREILFYDDKIAIFKARHGKL